jgi:acyl dehydratase
MPIDPARAVGAELPASSSAWREADVILYHLGLGAGADATHPRELAYCYERGLRVLPTFGVLPAFPAVEQLHTAPGLDFDWAHVLHGEHELEVFGELPPSGEVESRARVSEIYDKGSAALVVVDVDSRTPSGERLFANRISLFIRGEGGFGGPSGPSGGEPRDVGRPDREPDLRLQRTTLPQQALLYRLSGDRNPLHVDPAVAQRGGFDRPILHGLCSYGIVAKAVVDELLDGDVARVAAFRARFAGVVFPGETLDVELWRDDGRIVIEARCHERATPVLTRAALTLRAPHEPDRGRTGGSP